MNPTFNRRALARIAGQWGLSAPSRGRRGLTDTHVLFAACAAFPVLLCLALWVGPAMRQPAGAVAWFSFVVLHPVLEELVFRGVLQGELLQWTRGRRSGPFTRANLGTSVVFAAAHLLAQPPAWALATFVPSLVFGHLRDRLRSAWPAVLLHGFYNLGFALAAAWAHARTP